MSIAAFIVTAALAGSSAWVTSRWSGSHNLPTDAQVDALVAETQRRRVLGLHDHDDVMPGLFVTYGEFLEATVYATPLFSEAQIEAASEDVTIAPLQSRNRIVAWLSGGYNNPKTHDEVDACPPFTQRGMLRSLIPRSAVFWDEPPSVSRLSNPTGLGQEDRA